jgi:hypothetical protein
MEHADAMGEPRMRCAGIDQFRKGELLYSTKPLKRLRLDNSPQRLLKLLSIELNNIVQGIAYPLRLYLLGWQLHVVDHIANQ